MPTTPLETVVAGTRGFAMALVAPIAKRLGARPHLAADPSDALALCGGPGALVVVEFLGVDSIGAIKQLVLEGGGIRIVAAVPDAHADAAAPLRALGADPVRWDGTPEGILEAIDRQIAAAAAAATPPSPLHAQPGPAAAPARPPGAAPARPAAPPPPVRPPAAAAPARPAAPPPPAQPASAAPPAASRPYAPPAARHPGALAPAPLAPADPFAPAAAGPLERLGDERGASVGAPGAGPLRPVPAAEARSAGAGFFDDLPRGDAGDLAANVVDGRAHAPASREAAGPWPTSVPDPAQAADALGSALAGEPPPEGTPLAFAAVAIAGLTRLERAVLSGAPQPFDTEPVRRAAVMRVRVAAALATAPLPGAAVDAAAVSAFLAEIDALLSDVAALAAAAPAGEQASLEAVRNGLVKEAIDFSEAAQRASATEAPGPAAPRARIARTRVLSMSAERAEEPAPPRQRALLAGLVVVVLAAAAFHGYRWWSAAARLREAPTLAVGLAGAIGPPADLPDVANAPKVLTRADGEAFDAEELRAFAAKEARAGNTVQEIAPGTILVVPGNPGPPPSER